MCRNIRTLHNFDPPATADEVHGAALQYVRKISGFTKPSLVNQEAFDRAVDEIAHVSQLGSTATASRPSMSATAPPSSSASRSVAVTPSTV